MPTLFRTTRRVEFADTDMAGIVHFSNFFRFMEAAEVDFLQTRGLSVSQVREGERVGFPRVAASCDYLRPARFQDILDISVQVDTVGRKSVGYVFTFQVGDTLIAKGSIKAVYCRTNDDHQLESLEIPDSIRALLEQ